MTPEGSARTPIRQLEENEFEGRLEALSAALEGGVDRLATYSKAYGEMVGGLSLTVPPAEGSKEDLFIPGNDFDELESQARFYRALLRAQEDLVEECSEHLEALEREERNVRADVELLEEKFACAVNEGQEFDRREAEEADKLTKQLAELKAQVADKLIVKETMSSQLIALEKDIVRAAEMLDSARAENAELAEKRRMIEELERAEQAEVEKLQATLEDRQVSLRIAETQLLALSESRRELNNRLQNVKGSIRVCLRLKPLVGSGRPLLSAEGRSVKLRVPPGLIASKNQPGEFRFRFEHIFDYDAGQQQVFEELRSLATSVVDGFNVCIIAYGQTGAGKTHTIIGAPEHVQRGLAPRALEAVFELLDKERDKGRESKTHVSVSEIYLDSVRSLVDEKSPQVEVTNVFEAFRVFQAALARRVTASTASNERSSRSHLLFSLSVAIRGGPTPRQGALTLVDLAGSERLDASQVTGERLKEMLAINKSLSALGDVMNALYRKEKFVAFRNQKLTMALQDFLVGDSKVVMIVNLSNDESEYHQTLSSLKFAAKVSSLEGLQQ